MADRTSFVTQRNKTIGDIAVDGLLAGMAAGLIMGVILILLGLLDGVGPVEMLGRFDPAGGGAAALGGLLHLAVSGLYGVGFALLFRPLIGRWPSLRRYSWALGVAFGLGIWLAAQWILLPGLDLKLSLIVPWHFALAHVMYGATLGYLLNRHDVP